MKWSRKFLIILSFVALVMLPGGRAWAEYPDYLKGDKNYILCGGHMGRGWYVDKASLMVQQDNAPNYLIAVEVVEVDNADRGNTAIANKNKCRYSYDGAKNKMYSFWEDEWHYIEPVGCMAQTGHEFSGEMAFYLAFHKKFYGGKKWLDATTGEYAWPNFGEELYTRVDRARD